MRNPLIDFFKDFNRSIKLRHKDSEDQFFRVPMTMPQIERTIINLEDAEYFKQTTDALCEQVEDVKAGLDSIERRAMTLTELCNDDTQLQEIRQIVSEVNRLRDLYGRVDIDE